MANNLPIATIEQFTEIIKQQFQEQNYRPIFGLGKGGIGKTESIADLAKELGIGYIDIRLLLYSEVDLKGIPYPDSSNTHTIWLQNSILPIASRDGDKGILVLDEITSPSKSVRTAAYQLLNERKLGEYILPDNWLIVCLGNGEEDGGDFQGMEGNFANRCSVFNVVPNLDAWKSWAYRSGVNYLVTAYVSWRPSDLHTYNPDNEEMLFASPRSWNAVSDILNRHPFDKDDVLTQMRILANLGTRVGNQFISFCKLKDKAIEPSDIVAGRPVGRINEQEVLFLTIQGVIKLMHDAIDIDRTNNGGLLSIDTCTKCANGIKWMLTLDSVEHQVMALKDFVKSDRMAVTKMILNKDFMAMCPELSEFMQKNRVIFTNN